MDQHRVEPPQEQDELIRTGNHATRPSSIGCRARLSKSDFTSPVSNIGGVARLPEPLLWAKPPAEQEFPGRLHLSPRWRTCQRANSAPPDAARAKGGLGQEGDGYAASTREVPGARNLGTRPDYRLAKRRNYHPPVARGWPGVAPVGAFELPPAACAPAAPQSPPPPRARQNGR